MTLTIDLSPQDEARLTAVAKQEGLPLADYVQKLVAGSLPTARPAVPADSASIALAQSWIAQAPTDPEAVREAEEDLLEFKRGINAERKQAGARMMYPDAP